MEDPLEVLKTMVQIRPGVDYIAVTLLGTPEGTLSWSVVSHWLDFADGEPRPEVRKASIVKADRMAKLWSDLSQPSLMVHDESELFLFHALGGNALVALDIAKTHHPEWLEASTVAAHGYTGYISLNDLPPGALRRAPTPKERMRVLKRDNFRCRLCGRRADDHVDVELHVHHIRPWADGGVTYADNLITLCHTCHKGLEPHGDLSLFDLLGVGLADLAHAADAQDFWASVQQHRNLMRRALEEAGFIVPEKNGEIE